MSKKINKRKGVCILTDNNYYKSHMLKLCKEYLSLLIIQALGFLFSGGYVIIVSWFVMYDVMPAMSDYNSC